MRSNRSLLKHHIFLSVYSLFLILPFLWLVMSSFKSQDEFIAKPLSMPEKWISANYTDAWNTVDMPLLFRNSLLLCVVSVVGVLLLASFVAFIVSRLRFKFNFLLMNFFLLGMMIPINAAVIPLFINLKQMGLINTFSGVILSYIAFNLPMAIFLMTGYMKSIPKELDEAAYMDGCSTFGLFWKVILPISRPVFATAAIVIFMVLWNEFLFVLLTLEGNDRITVPLGLMKFAGEYSVNYASQMAAIVIFIIPIIIVYVLLRKQIIRGMAEGAVKA